MKVCLKSVSYCFLYNCIEALMKLLHNLGGIDAAGHNLATKKPVSTPLMTVVKEILCEQQQTKQGGCFHLTSTSPNR